MNRPRQPFAGPVLALALLLASCASGATSTRNPYRELNRSLRGERAIVELAGGEVALGVSRVRFDEAETSWSEDHRRRAVDTRDVSRVIVVTGRDHSPEVFALLLGFGLSMVLDDPAPLAIAVDIAIDSFVWGAEVPLSQGHVVYSSPALE
jgi:hypothetical protein